MCRNATRYMKKADEYDSDSLHYLYYRVKALIAEAINRDDTEESTRLHKVLEEIKSKLQEQS